MASQINPSNIDGSYPVAGQDNNSQGFRDNFTNTRVNFQAAQDEISELQSKSVLTSSIGEAPLTNQNNMAGSPLIGALVRNFSTNRVSIPQSIGGISINYAEGHYQTITTSGSISVSFNNWPGIETNSYAYLKLQITVTNIAHTVTINAPTTVGLLLGTSGIQNYTAINPWQGVISFGSTGVFEFGFGTDNGGNAITIFDLTRALTNFIAADLQVDDVIATGNLLAGVGGVGFVSATGNVIASQQLISIGNVTSGNLNTPGIVSASGNIIGANFVKVDGNVDVAFVNSRIRPTAPITNSGPAGLQLSSGELLASPTAGSFEYDGNVFYINPTSNQRGVLPSESFICLSSDFVGLNTTTAQRVFNSTATGAITLPGSTTYMFEAVYYLVRSAGTVSHTLATLFGGTASFSSITYIAETTSSAGNILSPVNRIFVTGTGATPVTAASTAANENITVMLRGLFRTNVGGTLIPQVQYSASPGGAPTFIRNSFFRLVSVGSSSVTSVGNWS
jgi:hypothetical protein